MTGPVRIGTRASRLARWQTAHVAELLRTAGIESEPVPIRTTGDLVTDVPLPRIGDRALFTRQLDEALLDGRIDLAVHSLKDLPTTLPEGVALVAVPGRADPRDALVGRSSLALRDLPAGSIVATSSLRRRAQLLHARPDLTVPDLRGNVETRIGRLDAMPSWAAIVLAAAGLERLDLTTRITERLPLDLMLPAPGQGALAVTARGEDSALRAALARALDRPDIARAVAAERAVLATLEGGCHAPIAAIAEEAGGTLHLRARVLSLDGRQLIEETAVVDPLDDAAAAGREVAGRLMARGAGELVEASRAPFGMPS